MRTFNKMNTTDVKKARKESKELRKLKMSKNTVMFIETDEKLKGQDVSFNEDYICIVTGKQIGRAHV